MPKVCDQHNVRDTKKGAGKCRISYAVRKRTGKPNWWCHTHGLEASAPDGAPLQSCAGAWFDAVPDDLRTELDIAEGEHALWGALPPAIAIGDPELERGAIHVHRRRHADAAKDIDASFDIVHVRHGDRLLVVEGIAARAYTISTLCGRVTVPLSCPRCGETHIDELKFATRDHRKHECNSCGRHFWNRLPTISNPLAQAHDVLGIPTAPPPTPINRPVEIVAADYTAVALWPSNTAFINTMSRPEEAGIHVHAWKGPELVLDQTYAPVILDGDLVDEAALRALAVQRSLASRAPIVSVSCQQCGAPLMSPTDGWIEPKTSHVCMCGATTKTRLKSFVNPLAEK